jgi:hypothetical protein
LLKREDVGDRPACHLFSQSEIAARQAAQVEFIAKRCNPPLMEVVEYAR